MSLAVDPSSMRGAKGTFVCPPVMISMGSNSVSKEVLTVTVFKGSEVVELLPCWKRA
jgi:hypothetical protein